MRIGGRRHAAQEKARYLQGIKKAEEGLKNNLKNLQQFKELTVDRENIMIESKKEVNRLSEELKKPAPYNFLFFTV